MRSLPAVAVATLLATAPALAHHQPRPAPGSLMGVSVEVEGAEAPLYAAIDRSGRFYLEARRGAHYSVRLDNRTAERLGVVLTVDGLNAISGEREPSPAARPGRMYVLEGWDTAVVQGWRTSLNDVRRFAFVDERASYAARSGKANAKMGWIEIAVYRERESHRTREPWDRIGRAPSGSGPSASGRDEAESDAAKRAEAPPATAPPSASESTPDLKSGAVGGARSYPGTGWGSPAYDPATVVEFFPRPHAAERVTVRYEYAPALQALGILPRPAARDRLRDRERGDGFARPPAW